MHQKMDAVNLENSRIIAEYSAKEENVKLLSEHNRSLIQLLEEEEQRHKSKKEEVEMREKENSDLLHRLQELQSKAARDEQIALTSKDEAQRSKDALVSLEHDIDHLRGSLANCEAQAKVDIESLEQALSLAKRRTVEAVQQQQSLEVSLKRNHAELQKVQSEKARLETELKDAFDQIKIDEHGKNGQEGVVQELNARLLKATAQVDSLRKALDSAEKQIVSNEEESRANSDRLRELSDRYYAAIDAIRLNEVELKKLEADSNAKNRKLHNVEQRLTQSLAQNAAETEKNSQIEIRLKDLTMERAASMKKLSVLEDQSEQWRKRVEDLSETIRQDSEKVRALESQNSFLQARVEGQEEEKVTLLQEVRRMEDKFKESLKSLRDENLRVQDMETKLISLSVEKDQLKSDIQFMRRENLLDATGRLKPTLIEVSPAASLVEKMKINEFLTKAQASSAPIPLMVEKIGHLIELVHTAQSNLDKLRSDHFKSNQLAVSLRKKNVNLLTKAQEGESFKSTIVRTVIMNTFAAAESNPNMPISLKLSSIPIDSEGIKSILHLAESHKSIERIESIDLCKCSLKDDCMSSVISLAVNLPYLRRLDISQNHFSSASLRSFEGQLRTIPGVTHVSNSIPNVGNVHNTSADTLSVFSGNQLRIAIIVFGQSKDLSSEDMAFEMMDTDYVHSSDKMNEMSSFGKDVLTSSVHIESQHHPGLDHLKSDNVYAPNEISPIGPNFNRPSPPFTHRTEIANVNSTFIPSYENKNHKSSRVPIHNDAIFPESSTRRALDAVYNQSLSPSTFPQSFCANDDSNHTQRVDDLNASNGVALAARPSSGLSGSTSAVILPPISSVNNNTTQQALLSLESTQQLQNGLNSSSSSAISRFNNLLLNSAKPTKRKESNGTGIMTSGVLMATSNSAQNNNGNIVHSSALVSPYEAPLIKPKHNNRNSASTIGVPHTTITNNNNNTSRPDSRRASSSSSITRPISASSSTGTINSQNSHLQNTGNTIVSRLRSRTGSTLIAQSGAGVSKSPPIISPAGDAFVVTEDKDLNILKPSQSLVIVNEGDGVECKDVNKDTVGQANGNQDFPSNGPFLGKGSKHSPGKPPVRVNHSTTLYKTKGLYSESYSSAAAVSPMKQEEMKLYTKKVKGPVDSNNNNNPNTNLPSYLPAGVSRSHYESHKISKQRATSAKFLNNVSSNDDQIN